LQAFINAVNAADESFAGGCASGWTVDAYVAIRMFVLSDFVSRAASPAALLIRTPEES
jgi:hypothetical protein